MVPERFIYLSSWEKSTQMFLINKILSSFELTFLVYYKEKLFRQLLAGNKGHGRLYHTMCLKKFMSFILAPVGGVDPTGLYYYPINPYLT